MSVIGDNVITRLNYSHREVGRKFKSTKQYHQWEFSLNGTYHKIELFHSFITGRKKLVVDGDYILKDDSYFSDFKFEFEIEDIIVEIRQKKLNVYKLYICGKSFDIMKQEEAQGINKEEVEKKIEKLKEEEIKNIKLIPKQELTIGVIHNITPNVNEAHLKEIFSNYGEVKEVYIPINDETQLKKNYAFIEFVKKENAEKARLYMDGGQIDGKVVTFEILAKKNCIEM